MKESISQLTNNPIEQKILSNLFSIEPSEREKFFGILLNGAEAEKKSRKKAKASPPILDIPEYNGAAVYALVDDNGKRYIGSTLHLKDRIKQHKAMMRTVYNHGPNGFVNPKITSALLEGLTFRCEILVMINTDVSKYELEEMERVFVKHFGGTNNTYNCKPLKCKV